MGKTCAVCGKPSGIYPLCPACFKLRDEGKIQKCEKCEKWHRINEPCDCVVEEQPTTKITGLKCLTCDNEATPGFHFCIACYKKYKDREIDMHIKNCSEFAITDEYGNKRILAKDGRRVRSRAEKIISDFFFDNHIRVVYEKDIPYTENGEDKVLHPDFFLPDYGEIENGRQKGMIIEYNELETKDYLRRKEYAMNVYKEKGFEVVILSSKDIDDDLLSLKKRFGLY